MPDCQYLLDAVLRVLCDPDVAQHIAGHFTCDVANTIALAIASREGLVATPYANLAAAAGWLAAHAASDDAPEDEHHGMTRREATVYLMLSSSDQEPD